MRDRFAAVKAVTSIVGLVLTLASCGSSHDAPSAVPSAAGPAAPSPGSGRGILFIGNSLTTTNGLPAMVEFLARESGGPSLVTRTVAEGGFSLEDHWNRGVAQRAIADGGWSVVVLQQGPSALPESQENLREYTQRFDAPIRSAGARTALYMVWPEWERAAVFDDVAASYTRAAEVVNGLLYPVGEAWQIAWRRDPRLALYGPDGFHPSPTGTYLAALVMFEQISGRSLIGLPSPLPSLDAATVRVLQESAAEANARFARP